MKKLALFVEGQTELIFATELLIAIAGTHKIAFHVEEYRGKTFQVLQSDLINGQSYFALIVDCGSDSSVLSAMLDRHTGLSQAQYDLILGLRDLYPIADADHPRLLLELAAEMPTNGSRMSVIVAKREVEAWFAQEASHFPRIHPSLTVQAIKTATGFDIVVDCAETLNHPAEFLHTVYQHVGMAYRKRRNQVERTVAALDMHSLYTDLPAKLPSLQTFTSELDAFLA